MKPSEIRYWTKDYPEQVRREREADRPRRLKVMTPEAATFWISVLDRAEPMARAATWKRPCDYAPWSDALEKIASIDKDWPPMGDVPDAFPTSNIMSFARDVACPGWPEGHAHLVEFALRFLEADVMLFNSGYVKRHLLRRLRQAHWTDQQTDRAEALLRRAVVEGTGLEEYREFCRLASRVLNDDLGEWLADQAERAFLTLGDLDGDDYLRWAETLGEDALQKLAKHGLSLRLKHAFAADPPHSIIKIKDLPEDNRIRRNAWRMLRHIKRTGI